MEDLFRALYSLAILFVGLVLLFAQVRLFTYLPKTYSQLEEVLRHLEKREEAQR
jgi:hypothetical protein